MGQFEASFRVQQDCDFVNAGNVRRMFKDVCKLAGIGENWTPRELHTSFVSLMSNSGVSTEEIARLVSHSSTHVTETVYRRGPHHRPRHALFHLLAEQRDQLPCLARAGERYQKLGRWRFAFTVEVGQYGGGADCAASARAVASRNSASGCAEWLVVRAPSMLLRTALWARVRSAAARWWSG